MVSIRYLTACAILIAFGPAQALAQDFPEHPGNMKDAEAQKLARVGIAELKVFIPGSILVQGKKGGTSKTKIFKSDNSLEIPENMNVSGTWKFNEKHDGYCNTIVGRNRTTENCFFVFKAADGVHYFDYDAENGFYSAVWRPAANK